MTTLTWTCCWCEQTVEKGTQPDPTGCPRHGQHTWDVVMPTTYREYEAIIHTQPKPDWCKACQSPGFGPSHWPLFSCRSANGPGKGIRPHCTCDGCF